MKNQQTPFSLFKEWYDEALNRPVDNPSAVVLGTADVSGKPSMRVVLLKDWNEAGFVFYSNYESRKGNDLETNPQASLLFYWEDLGKQIRIEGRVEKISVSESEHYFQSRPQASQWGAWASKQSQSLLQRSILEERFEEVKMKFPEKVPLPHFWGGYRLAPHRFEFWQSQEHRLHVRTLFEKTDTGWKSAFLYP